MDSQTPVSYHYISTQDKMGWLAEQIARADVVALDTEADSLHHYYAKVCLMQLTVEGEHYIVDPLAGTDMAEVMAALQDVTLIMHSADSDLRMLRQSFGFEPGRPVFDTMLAAQLLGYEGISLAALVEKHFGVVLPKQGRKSDWSARPLTGLQLSYAVNDTLYLPELMGIMTEELTALGREDWHRQWCERIVEATQQEKEPVDPDHAWRIKGLRHMGRRELAMVRAIWQWREEQAQRADRPPFKIMGNGLIIELAVWAAHHDRASLASGPKLPRHFAGHRQADLQRVIDKARALPESKWPEPRKPRGGVIPAEVDCTSLRKGCAAVAEELGIETSVVAARAALESIARRRPKTLEKIIKYGGLMRWQGELIQPAVEKYLADYPEND